MHQATEFKLRWHTTKNQNQTKDMLCVLMEQRMKIPSVAMSFTPPPSKIIELLQLCSALSQDLFMAYSMSNKVGI
jgi:hypothetical protein